MEIIDIICGFVGEKFDDHTFAVLHSDVYDECVELKKKFAEKTGVEIAYEPFDLGTTIGAHIGRTVLGICYIPKYETVK
jgi:fatty acid-binding protein DegV